jgi:hypothetical protein
LLYTIHKLLKTEKFDFDINKDCKEFVINNEKFEILLFKFGQLPKLHTSSNKNRIVVMQKNDNCFYFCGVFEFNKVPKKLLKKDFFILDDFNQLIKPNDFLENVRNLEKHDNGKTFTTIKNLLKEQGYSVYYQIIKACDFGLPQLRERIFIVAFLDDYIKNFVFPEKKSLLYTMSDIFKEKCNRDIGFTLRVGGRGSKINDRRNWEFYEVGGKIKRIGIKEAKMMMGFPENFIFPVSECQAMKQLGNSVAVLAVKAVAENVINYIKNKVYTSSKLLKNNQIFSINDDSNKKDLLL